MTKTTRSSRIDTVFVLIIFCVFAISVLMVLMLGADIYKNMTDISREGYDERTGLSYIWTKVKNNDEAGRIHLSDFHGVSALCFDEEFDSSTYRTMIYYYDGWVYELFYDISLDFLPSDGAQIIEISDLKFEELQYGLIRVSSGASSLLVSPRGSSAQAGPFTKSLEGGLSG